MSDVRNPMPTKIQSVRTGEVYTLTHSHGGNAARYTDDEGWEISITRHDLETRFVDVSNDLINPRIGGTINAYMIGGLH